MAPDPVLQHGVIHAKQLGDHEYVLYQAVPGTDLTTYEPPAEDHLLILTGADVAQIALDLGLVSRASVAPTMVASTPIAAAPAPASPAEIPF